MLTKVIKTEYLFKKVFSISESERIKRTKSVKKFI
jgi:hypothetical protein